MCPTRDLALALEECYAPDRCTGTDSFEVLSVGRLEKAQASWLHAPATSAASSRRKARMLPQKSRLRCEVTAAARSPASRPTTSRRCQSPRRALGTLDPPPSGPSLDGCGSRKALKHRTLAKHPQESVQRAHFRVPLYSIPHFSFVSTWGSKREGVPVMEPARIPASLPVRSLRKGFGFTGTVAMAES